MPVHIHFVPFCSDRRTGATDPLRAQRGQNVQTTGQFTPSFAQRARQSGGMSTVLLVLFRMDLTQNGEASERLMVAVGGSGR